MVHLAAVSICVFLLALLGNGHATDTPSNFLDDSNNQFTLDFYQAIRNNSENIIASPVSLKMLLALLLLGAERATAAEIAKVLHHPRDDVRTLEAYKSMIIELHKSVLKMANNVFVEISYRINPDFLIKAITYFFTNIQRLDFKGDPNGSGKKINAWVESITHNKIKNLFSHGSLSPETQLGLVSAIHFKAKWMHQFKKKNTKDAFFFKRTNQPVDVKMMSIVNITLPYKDSTKLGAQMFELFYEKVIGFSMVIMLPHTNDGLPELENKLAHPGSLSELHDMAPELVNVHIPRFKLENQLDLEPILKKLGMTKAFSYQAEFSKISNDPLKISKVVQKAFIEVNEEGTEATAATGTGFMTFSFPLTNSITCDHPFIFLVMKERTILFMGRVSNPE